MSSPPRLLAFAGSLRRASFNRRLIGALVQESQRATLDRVAAEAVAAASALRALRTR